MIREYQAVINTIVNRINSAKQKVNEFRKIISTPEHREVATLGVRKRLRLEAKQQRGHLLKHRKCKDALKVVDDNKEDIIEVLI